MKRKVLITTVALATLTLAACHRPSNRADYMRNSPNTPYTSSDYRNDYANDYRNGYAGNNNVGNGYENDYTSSYGNGNAGNNNTGYDNARYGNTGYDNAGNNNSSTMDPHYDYVNQLGFTNITNAMGDSYYRRYRLDSRNAADNDVFHGWRHTWVEPNDYIDKDIDVYRYTGDYNGQNRTVHILSHRGTPIGGYHFGEGETAEHARMIDRDGYSSRIADDFRNTWDDMFNIRH